MSKKVHSSGYPRKFIDKIALIKQKEALTNAYFESAIQGLSDISMKRKPTNQSIYSNDIQNNVYSVENNLNKYTDDFSNTSFSPQSFTSDSTINNLQGNINYQQINVNNSGDTKNDLIERFYENPENNSSNNLQSFGSVKFRTARDNSGYQNQFARLSNNEGYPCFKDDLTRDLNEQISSGSLPDVSSFNNRNYVQSSFGERISVRMPKEINPDSINLKEVLSNLKKVKKGSNSKKALYEHLRSRGIQNPHPHHVHSEPVNQNLASILGSPSMNRSRAGYIHNHDNSGCAANNSETGHLKHYSASNSPYLSLLMRDQQCNKDFDSSLRKRHASNNVITLQSQMELNLNCQNDINSYEIKQKSLTPTENLQNSMFTMNEGHLLPPAIFGMISADHCRRASSDSSIQNSLKQCNNNISQTNFLYSNEGNSFGKSRNFKNDPSVHLYHRIKSMTSDPINNFQSSINESSKYFNLQRDNSTSSSFLDSYMSRNSPDENLDPNIDFIANSAKSPLHQFIFGDLNQLPEESNISIADNHRCSCIGDNNDPSQMSNPTQLFEMMNTNSIEPSFESALKRENSHYSIGDTEPLEHSDQCYWAQPAESDSNNYSKEPSPLIKPCENLDPQNVTLDLNTDFSCIPDIILSDADAQRRNSLKMADEVLNNLNMESSNSEFIQCREKLNFYQPMDMLSEETIVKSFEDEY